MKVQKILILTAIVLNTALAHKGIPTPTNVALSFMGNDNLFPNYKYSSSSLIISDITLYLWRVSEQNNSMNPKRYELRVCKEVVECAFLHAHMNLDLIRNNNHSYIDLYLENYGNLGVNILRLLSLNLENSIAIREKLEKN